MKRTVSILLAMLLLFAALTVVGCSKKEDPLKMGLGVYTNVSKASDAEGDTDGQGKVAITGAIITVDAENTTTWSLTAAPLRNGTSRLTHLRLL